MGPVVEKKSRKKPIPSYLIYEEMDGKPIYRKGYKEVLAKKKTVEEIMGSSVLQTVIINAILRFLYRNLPDHYVIGTNEPGLHLAKGNNLSNDIAVYDKKDIPDDFSRHYFDITAKFVIEVDIKAEVESFTTENDYIYIKTTKLLDFGVPKVIGITTDSRKLMVAEPGKNWIVADWNCEVGLIEGLRLNLEELLKAEGHL